MLSDRTLYSGPLPHSEAFYIIFSQLKDLKTHFLLTRGDEHNTHYKLDTVVCTSHVRLCVFSFASVPSTGLKWAGLRWKR